MKEYKNIFAILLLQFLLLSCYSETKESNEVKTESSETKSQVKEETKTETKTEEKTSEGLVEIKPEELKTIGLKTIIVNKSIMPQYLKTSGEIQENENLTTHVNSKLSGRVINVYKSVGDYVNKGEVIAVIDSKELANIESDLLETKSKINTLEKEIINRKKISLSSIAQQQKYIDFMQQTYNRQKKLFDEGISPRKNIEEADKNLKTANIEKEKIVLKNESETQKLRGEINNLELQAERITKELQIYNFSNSEINKLLATRQLNTSSSIYSPISGLVSGRHISLGESVEPNKDIITIMNPDDVWIYANVYEKDIAKIIIGQEAYITPRSYPGKQFNAVVNYVLPQVEDKSRVAKVRLSLVSKTNILRKGMFTDVFINIGSNRSTISIPKEAIQRDNNKEIVYIKKTDTSYQSVPIVTGKSDANNTEIISGLKVGEIVVTKGSFTLKSISKKGEMGEE